MFKWVQIEFYIRCNQKVGKSFINDIFDIFKTNDQVLKSCFVLTQTKTFYIEQYVINKLIKNFKQKPFQRSQPFYNKKQNKHLIN